MKKCYDCKIEKPLSDFYKRGGKGATKRLNELIGICKPCSRKDSSLKGPKNRYKRKYNLSVEQVKEMLINQNSCCGICQIHIHLGEERKDGDKKIKATAYVDHNHTHGYIRELLCDNCNKGLGNFKDSTNFLANAQNYLLKHESNNINQEQKSSQS